MARRPTYRELEQKIRTLEKECAKGKQAAEERKRVEELIRQREEKYHTILETAMDGFWVADVEGRILEVNDAFCRMSGYSKEELQAMRIDDLEAAETADDIAAHGRKIMAQGEDRFESRHRRKDGSIIEVEVSILR